MDNLLDNASELNKLRVRSGFRQRDPHFSSVGIAQSQLAKRITYDIKDKQVGFFKKIGIKPDPLDTEQDKLSYCRGVLVDKVMFRCNNLNNIGIANDLISKTGIDEFAIAIGNGVKKIFDKKQKQEEDEEV